MNPGKILIINADDFGLSRSINKGVIHSMESGIVSSTSLFANLPGFDDAVRLIKDRELNSVGLHFNLTYGEPVSSKSHIASLINGQGAFRLKELDWGNTGWKTEEISLEFEAQYKKIEDSGITITHIDSHHYIHNYHTVYKVLVEAATRHSLPLRKTRKPKEPPIQITTDHLISEEYFKNNCESNLIEILSNIKSGITEINCHPGYSDEVVEEISDWTTEREVEMDAFTAPGLSDFLESHDIKLIGFDEIQEYR